MAENYSIKITVSNETLSKLKTKIQSLRIYKGVQGSVEDGFCTLWHTTKQFSRTMNIDWEEKYGVYIDNQQLPTVPSKLIVINTDNIKPLTPGELMAVEDDGTTKLTTNGTKDKLGISSFGERDRICGIAQSVNDELSPMCAIPLKGNDYRNIKPLEKVLLNFDSGYFKTGTIVEKAWERSLLIDFSLTDERQICVSYDFEKGWETQSTAWTKVYMTSVQITDKLNVPISMKPLISVNKKMRIKENHTVGSFL